MKFLEFKSKFFSMIVAACVFLSTMSFATQTLASDYWEGVKQRGELRCAAAIAAPYVMKNPKTGEYGGAYLDLCKEFADVLGVKVVFVDTTWDNIVAGLQSGKWDLAPALNLTPQRALAISFSGPAGYDAMTFLYRTDSEKVGHPTPDLKTLDVPGMRIGVVAGTAQDKAVTQRFKNAQVVRLPQLASLQLAILSGQVDVGGFPYDGGVLAQKTQGDHLTLLNPKPALIKQAIGFGLPRSMEPRDIAVFNIFLEEKVALGEVDDSMIHYGQIMLGKTDW